AAVNPARYAALVAATPEGRFPATALARREPAPGTVPVLATRAAAVQLGHGSTGLQVGARKLPIRVVGTVGQVAGVAATAVVVLPGWALGRVPAPTLMLVVGPNLDGQALEAFARRALPGATVTLRSRTLAALAGAPVPHGGGVALAAGAAA